MHNDCQTEKKHLVSFHEEGCGNNGQLFRQVKQAPITAVDGGDRPQRDPVWVWSHVIHVTCTVCWWSCRAVCLECLLQAERHVRRQPSGLWPNIKSKIKNQHMLYSLSWIPHYFLEICVKMYVIFTLSCMSSLGVFTWRCTLNSLMLAQKCWIMLET